MNIKRFFCRLGQLALGLTLGYLVATGIGVTSGNDTLHPWGVQSHEVVVIACYLGSLLCFTMIMVLYKLAAPPKTQLVWRLPLPTKSN